MHKTGEIINNNVADAVAKSKDYKIVKQEPVEQLIILPEKREEILNELMQVL